MTPVIWHPDLFDLVVSLVPMFVLWGVGAVLAKRRRVDRWIDRAVALNQARREKP